MSIIEKMQENALCRALSSEAMQHLAGLLKIRQYQPGALIFDQDEAANELFLLVKGTVDLMRSEQHIKIAEMQAGHYFGEMGLFSNKSRNASAQAQTQVEVLVLNRAGLEQFEADTGQRLQSLLLESHCEVMNQRLVESSDKSVRALQDKLKAEQQRALFGSFFANIVLLIFVYGMMLELIKNFADTSLTILIMPIFMFFVFIGAVFYIKSTGLKREFFGFKRAKWRWALRDALLWTILLMAFFTGIKWLLLQSTSSLGNIGLFSFWTPSVGWFYAVIAYMSLAFLQEFIARGVLQGTLTTMFEGRYRVLKAILLSNAVFAIVHQHFGLSFVLIVFLTGLFWGWLYHRHKESLVGVTFSHFIFSIWLFNALDVMSVVKLI